MIQCETGWKNEYTDEKIGINYTLVGDYYLPNLVLKQEEKVILNKYKNLIIKALILMKPEKCSELLWSNSNNLPENMIDFERYLFVFYANKYLKYHL